MTGVVILVVVLVLATAFGLYRRWSDGRMRPVEGPVPVADDAPEVDVHVAGRAEHGGERVTAADLGAPLGAAATFVQFSTEFCQPCRVTRRLLDEIATAYDDVSHVELDAEQHLDLVRRFDIRRTPTVLVLDSRGVIVKRASGVPRRIDVVTTLGDLNATGG